MSIPRNRRLAPRGNATEDGKVVVVEALCAMRSGRLEPVSRLEQPGDLHVSAGTLARRLS